MMPLTMDLETKGPRVRQPTTSKKAPHVTAWNKVRALLPTAVPTELQISLAAFAQAVRKAPASPSAKATSILEASNVTSVTTTALTKITKPVHWYILIFLLL